MLRDACYPVYRILNDPSAASLKINRPCLLNAPSFWNLRVKLKYLTLELKLDLKEQSLLAKKNFNIVHLHCKALVVKFIVYKVTHVELCIKQ